MALRDYNNFAINFEHLTEQEQTFKFCYFQNAPHFFAKFAGLRCLPSLQFCCFVVLVQPIIPELIQGQP